MRARSLKPGFFANDELAEIEPLGRILFQGLWCVADREGRLADRPRKIKAEVLPYDDCDTDRLLNDLSEHGFILRYEADGTRYIQVVNFDKHQNPHIKEAPSTIPAPSEHCVSTVQEPDHHETSPLRAPEQHWSKTPDSGLRTPDSISSPNGDGAREAPLASDGDLRELWTAFVEGTGQSPTTKGERQKWNGGLKELWLAGIRAPDVSGLLGAYRERYGEIDVNPRAIANNLSTIRGQSRASPARPPDPADSLWVPYAERMTTSVNHRGEESNR